jgi:hypothetical protein
VGEIKWILILIISIFILSSSTIATNFPRSHYEKSTHVEMINTQPSPENVYQEIDRLTDWYRYLDTPGHREAEKYISSKFKSFGLNTTRQEYTVQRSDGSKRGANVIGKLHGTVAPYQLLVLGGHYDANKYATQGAYDNAAGAATVLELARFFTEYYITHAAPEISLVFATWDAEEGGGAGSKYFVENLPEEYTIVAYLNFDMYALNYPVRNSLPGTTEDFFKLNLYTCPVVDFSGYSNYDFNDSTRLNFSIFQETLMNITYLRNGYPPEWVPVVDDTAVVSDHSHFIRRSIPAVWFRGMNEYPRDEGDLNERNFKHTPVDTLDTMERYAGGKSELLNGIETGLTIAYQFTFELLKLYKPVTAPSSSAQSEGSSEGVSDLETANWFIAGLAIGTILAVIHFYRISRSKKRKE